MSLEPPTYHPVKDQIRHDYFNLTMTYRTDSDIHKPYFDVVTRGLSDND